MQTSAFDRPDDQSGRRPPARDASQLDASPPFASDADIARGGTSGTAENIPLDVSRLQAGASVYSADGVEVAVVEMVRPDHVGVRSGSPGRPVDLPLNAIQRVGEDGRRLDLRLTSEDIERLAGADEPGYAHLAAQQPDDLAQHDTLKQASQPEQA